MKKVIVTGADGFIGQHLINSLIHHGYNITAVIRNSFSNIQHYDKRVNILKCDLNNIARLKSLMDEANYDAFFHLAWEGSTGISRANYEIQLSNVKQACDCAALAKDLGCKKFISTGTISEKLISQALELPNVSDNFIYAIAKNTTHLMLNSLCIKLDLPFIWAQLSNVYGSNNKTGNIISYTIETLKQGKCPEFSKAEQPYDFIHVEDVAEALVLLAENNTNKSAYFIGSGSPKYLKDYLIYIGETYGDVNAIHLGRRPDDNLKYSFSWFNTSSISQETGFCPKRSFEQNISKIIRQEIMEG